MSIVASCCILSLAMAVVDETQPAAMNWDEFRFDPAAAVDVTTLNLGAFDDQASAPTTAPDETTPPTTGQFAAAGTQRWMLFGGAGIDDDSNTLWQLGASVEWFIADDLSLDLGGNITYFDQEGPDAFGGGITLLVRWHFWHNAARTVSLYGDGGAGVMLTTEDVPFDGSSFNFTPQLGFGATVDVGDGNRVYTGIRWYHISNANTSSNNPARDSLYLYAGISFPF